MLYVGLDGIGKTFNGLIIATFQADLNHGQKVKDMTAQHNLLENGFVRMLIRKMTQLMRL